VDDEDEEDGLPFRLEFLVGLLLLPPRPLFIESGGIPSGGKLLQKE
jgi:hypothetical protein